MKELLTWLYGRGSRNAHIRTMAEKAILLLRREPMEYQKLCRALGIQFDKYQKPRRTFYFVVNPLKRVHLIKDKRIRDESDPKKHQTVYFLNPGAFQGYVARIVEEAVSNMQTN